jgi:hypothetical protein
LFKKFFIASLLLSWLRPGFAAAQVTDNPDAASPRILAAGIGEYRPILPNELCLLKTSLEIFGR